MLLLLSPEFASPQQQKEERTFPTKDRIQLLLTQSERAFEVYDQSLKQEAQMGGDWEKVAADDPVVLVNARDLIERLNKSPDGFNGPGFPWLAVWKTPAATCRYAWDRLECSRADDAYLRPVSATTDAVRWAEEIYAGD
jgi:hypothetical protein